MKNWMPVTLLLLLVSTTVAQEIAPLPFETLENDYSLDFSADELFPPSAEFEADWLPPPVACEKGSCPLEFEAEFSDAELFFCPVPNVACDLFATLAAATEFTKDGRAKCACKNCACGSGDRSKCQCGVNCQCASGACKCGPKCQCANGKACVNCQCGPQCQCKDSTLAIAKLAKGKCACGKKCACASGKACANCKCGPNCQCKQTTVAIAKSAKCKCQGDKCACGAKCSCGEAEIAKLKHELVLTYQQLKFEEHLAEQRVENLRRENQLLLELAETRAQAAQAQAALQQQSIAQHQQQQLIGHIVNLSGGAKPKIDEGHLQSRIEQLTIENVQLRHTIEEMRRKIEQLARQPATHR